MEISYVNQNKITCHVRSVGMHSNWSQGQLGGRPREAPDSSGVYICKSVVNELRHGNYICKSEESYLKHPPTNFFLASL